MRLSWLRARGEPLECRLATSGLRRHLFEEEAFPERNSVCSRGDFAPNFTSQVD